MSNSQDSQSSHVNQQQVHVVFVYHPNVDLHASQLPTAIVKRVAALYSLNRATILIGQVRYGHSQKVENDSNDDVQQHLASSSKSKVHPFITVDEYEKDLSEACACPSNVLQDRTNDVRFARTAPSWQHDLQMTIESNQGTDDANDELGSIVDGLVAAIEVCSKNLPSSLLTPFQLFSSQSTLTSPLARYLVHLLPSNKSIDLREEHNPHSNLDSSHDSWNWKRAATELGKAGSWPITAVMSGINSSTIIPAEAERVHQVITEQLPTSLPSNRDTPSVLGVSFKSHHLVKSMLLTGLSEAAVMAAKATSSANPHAMNKKKTRKLSTSEASQSIQAIQQSALNSSNSASRPTESDRQAMQKVLFLQQQQQMMLRNLKLLKDRQDREATTDPNHTSRIRLLEKYRDQLMTQHQLLRSYAANMSSSSALTDLSGALSALIAIDKEASEQGFHLGGPSNIQALMSRHRQHLQQQEQKAQNPYTALEMQPSVTSAADNALKRPGGQSFWIGAILWSIALPNKQRSQVATFVTAQCAPNTNKDNLMLPWPQKFVVSEVQSVSLASLQRHAATNGTPCILFQPQPLPQMQDKNERPPGAPNQQQTNESMYTMLARMIDSKKGCAFLKLQGPNAAPEAGIVVVPTTPPGGGTTKRLLGLIFRTSVPWHLFTPQPPAASSTNVAGASLPSSSIAPQFVAGPQVQMQQPILHQVQQPATQSSGIAPDAIFRGQQGVGPLNPQPAPWAPQQTPSENTSQQSEQSQQLLQRLLMQQNTSAPLANVMPQNIDIGALAQQFNLTSQANQQQAQPTSFMQQTLQQPWSSSYNGMNYNSNPVDTNQQMDSIDVSSLQRMLGLPPT